VSRVAPLRDLAPGAVPPLLTELRAWSGRCSSALASLAAQVAAVRQDAAARAADRASWDARLARTVDDERAAASLDGGGGSGAGSSVAAGKKAIMLGQRPPRFGKRGSSLIAAPDFDDDEAMDVDEAEDEAEGKKRASRRRL